MKKVYKSLLKKYGEDNQTNKVIEELSELIRAIARNDRDNIVEELADVTIMLEQLKLIYDIKDTQITPIIRYKCIRALGEETDCTE